MTHVKLSRTVRLALLIGAAFISSSACAQELTVLCRYEQTIDGAGKSSPTSGEMSVSATFIHPVGTPKNLKITTSKAPCYDFVGDGDDMKIGGTCIRFIEDGKMKMQRTLKIDRVSGAFEEIVQFNDKGGLVHMGHCLAASRKF